MIKSFDWRQLHKLQIYAEQQSVQFKGVKLRIMTFDPKFTPSVQVESHLQTVILKKQHVASQKAFVSSDHLQIEFDQHLLESPYHRNLAIFFVEFVQRMTSETDHCSQNVMR